MSTSAFATIAFLIGLAAGLVARNAGLGTLLRKDTHAADLAAIKKLEQEDIEVTLSQDSKGLVDVWAEDGVRFKPGSSPTIGKQAIAAENEKFHTQHPEFKVLKYAPDLKTVRIAIVDGWATEVGSTGGHVQDVCKRQNSQRPGQGHALAEAAERWFLEIRPGWFEITEGRGLAGLYQR